MAASQIEQMVTEAILALKERNGSSVQAIKKHIVTNHPDVAFAPHQLRSALKKGTESGRLIKVNNSILLWTLSCLQFFV